MEERKVAEMEAKDQVAQAEAEEILYKGVKKYKLGEDVVYIRHPNMKENNILQKEYASRFNKMLKTTDLPTRRELSKTLEQRGAWTKRDDEDIEELRKAYVDYYKEWYSFPYEKRIDNKDFDRLDTLYAKSMSDYMAKHGERESMFSQTIESSVDAELMINKIQMCVMSNPETKELYFKTVQDVENYEDAMAMNGLITACSYFWAGISERFLEQPPENIAGRKSTN